MNTRVVKFNLLPIILGLIGPGLFRLCASLQCGIPRVRHEALIVRGSATRQGEWPWHAAIYHRTSPRAVVEYACGGSLISHQFVLTAAHCTVNQNTGNKLSRGLLVRLGVHNLESIDPETAQQYSVKNVYTFDKFSRQNMRDDIALLELNESVQLTDYVVPVCINRQFNLTNDVGASVGWGFTENDKVSPVLRLARLPVIDDIDCLESDRDLFGKKFHKGMFCAGHTNGTSVCNGDSGGGLFFKRGEAWYVGGIVSFSKFREHGSNLCYTEGYAGFTKVAWYLTWISNVTGIDLDGRNGNPNPKPVIKRKKVPYIPRLSDEKCLEYQQSRTPDSNDRNIVVIRDQGVQTCLANVISERYLLSTGSCVRRTLDQASFTAEFYTNRYNFRLHDLKPMLHPNHSTTTSGGVPRDSVVLIDLGRNRDELKPDIACLWTDPNEITKDVVKGVIWPTEIGSGAPFNISETHDGKAITTSENISCDDDRIILGIRISLRKVGESYYRMVGPLIHCETSMYARLTGYLDWIEETVWPKKTQT